jgi:hypothetical protein
MFKFKDEVLPVKRELKYWYTWKILKALHCVWGIALYRKCVATSRYLVPSLIERPAQCTNLLSILINQRV